jgi:transcriptional antiterminator/mannitol/fructose-specific phosphotransferase system IIA component (Ntr-type)
MAVDSMMKQIVERLLGDTSVSAHRLMAEFGLSKSQLVYRMKKINEHLSDKRLPLIKKENHHYLLLLNREQKRLLLDTSSSLNQLQSDERQQYILLLIVLYENLTLGHLADKLGVSRNTILADMKLVNQQLSEYDLSLKSTRAKGYFLLGSEIAIRKLWLGLVKGAVEKDYALVSFKQLLDIDTVKLQLINQKIEALENRLHLSFSEVKITYLSMLIYLSIQRFALNETIGAGSLEQYGELLNQQTYSNVAALFTTLYLADKDEALNQELRFITMHILSINIVKSTSFKYNQALQTAIVASIERFEKLSITFFDNKEKLCEMLYQHIIPASYRIRFGVPDDNTLSHMIQQKYQAFYSIVKKAIKPVEQHLKIAFVDEELIYLLIIFLGFLKSDNGHAQQKKTAIVICMHSVSVSSLLLENLKELLPEIRFIRYMSLREFYDLKPKVDVIFSVVGVDTDIPSFIVKHFLTEEEKHLLRYKVERVIFQQQAYIGVGTPFSMDKLISVIEKHTSINSQELLKKDLEDLFFREEKKQSPSRFKGDADLLALLPQQHIQIYRQPLSFAQAIQMCGKPLLRKGLIRQAYIDTIIETYNPDYPYFVIAPEVAIPHAGPEEGVNDIGMSLLRVTHPIPFSSQLSVRILVMIAPKDKKSHLKAVTALYNLVSNQSFREQILSATYERDIYELFYRALSDKATKPCLIRQGNISKY